MSRDIFVQDLPSGAESVGEITEDFVPKPIGRRGDVISAIRRLAPHADFTDPAWGKLDLRPQYYIEINLGQSEELEGFAFHVSGGIEADRVIASILRDLNLRALDPSSDTGFFTFPNA